MFDVIFCRNVLIYFDQDTKISVFERLAKSLEPDGMLMLGAAESVVGITEAFRPYPDKRGLYQLNPGRGARPAVATMAPGLKAVAR
jgi:chemotaxis protein methyltransferase CheR